MFLYTQRFSGCETTEIVRYDPRRRLLQLQEKSGDIRLYEGLTEDGYIKLVQSNKDTDKELDRITQEHNKISLDELVESEQELRV